MLGRSFNSVDRAAYADGIYQGASGGAVAGGRPMAGTLSGADHDRQPNKATLQSMMARQLAVRSNELYIRGQLTQEL